MLQDRPKHVNTTTEQVSYHDRASVIPRQSKHSRERQKRCCYDARSRVPTLPGDTTSSLAICRKLAPFSRNCCISSQLFSAGGEGMIRTPSSCRSKKGALHRKNFETPLGTKDRSDQSAPLPRSSDRYAMHNVFLSVATDALRRWSLQHMRGMCPVYICR